MVNGTVMLTDLPALETVHKLCSSKLIKILRHCPFCETFGKPANELVKLSLGQMQEIIAKAII